MEDKLNTVSLGRRDRILKIQEMVESGLKISEIAQYYSISTRQVNRDLVVAKLLNQEEVKRYDQGDSLGREIKFWMQISRQAMRNYQTARTENARVGFMRLACEARGKLQKLLLDTGMITNSGAGTPGTDPQQAMEQMLKISGSIDLSVLGEKEE